MKKMIVQRLLHLVVVLFLVTLVSFFLMYFSPGDPVTALLSRGGTVPDPDVVAQKSAELGLDRPVAEQYVAWLAGIFQGNLGISIGSGRPVASEIAARMPATLFLAVTSLALTLVVSIPLGCLCALKKNRATDLIIRFASFAGASVPGFLMALILIFVFSLTLHWLPSIGSMKGAGWVLPVLTLVLCESAMYIRQIRTIVLQEMEQNYVEAARLRGISDVAILSRSVLKAAAPTILVLTGMTFAQLLGGSAIIENVFSWPGIGFYAVQAVFARDYPVVQAYVLIVAVLFVLVNLCVDLLQARIDPRARLALEQSAVQDRRVRMSRGKRRSGGLAGRRALYCGIVVLLIVAFSFVAPLLCQHDAELANLALSNRAPDGEFLMGTDSLGRCILCRVLTGLHTTVLAALAVVALSVVIGSALGALSGYIGGVFDSVVMRITDAFMAFPTLVLGIAIAGLLGGGLQNAVIALVVPGWTRFARIARSSVLALKERPFIQAAVIGGLSRTAIALKHVLPNILPPLIVTACLDIGGSMLSLAGLSFLGLGASPPSPELGAMINQAASGFQTAPWAVFAPGFAIFLVVAVFNYFGDSVNEALGNKGSLFVRAKK